MTALGADLVFLVRTVDKRTMDIMLGFAAGVTVAGSFWSLLLPAIEISTKVGMGSMAGVPAFASLVANLQMTIFSLKFEVSCLHLPTISIQQGRMQSLALQISRTNKPAIEAPEPKLIPLSIVTLNKCKEYLERPKKKRREPKVPSSKWRCR